MQKMLISAFNHNVNPWLRFAQFLEKNGIDHNRWSWTLVTIDQILLN